MGGFCSKYCPHAITPTTDSSFDAVMPASSNTSTSSKSSRILEQCIVIWLCDDPSNKFEYEKKQLARLMYGFTEFNNPDTCINHIKDIRDEKVFLIVSITYQSLQYIYNLPQLEKVYVLDLFSQETKSNSKSNNTFHNFDGLYKQLQDDIESCELDLIHFSCTTNSLECDVGSSCVLRRNEASFLFTQLVNEIIARLKFESFAKDVLIDFCRQHYAKYPQRLQDIEQFSSHYRPYQAIHWLKKSCFISKILHRVVRTRELDILYKLGFFIKHINTQLIHYHDENESLMKNTSLVYRGKTMWNEQFDVLIKNNCCGLLSFSNFLLASTDKRSVIEFIHRRLLSHPEMIGVVFEIHIDHAAFNEERPFALLKSNSTSNADVCFSAGCVFRIEAIENFTDNPLVTWLIKLSLVRNGDQQLENLLKPFRTNELHENPLSCLGKLLVDMGEYKRAEQFLLEMLKDTAIQSQPRRLMRVRNGLGANYAHQGNFAAALEHYEKALQISLTYLSPDHIDLAPIYKNIGDCYSNQKQYNLSLKNYEQAMDLIQNSSATLKADLIAELNNVISETKRLMDTTS